MPKMVTIEPNPDFKLSGNSSAETKASWEAIQKTGEKTVAAVTANQAVRLSGHMYRIKPDPKPVVNLPSLEDLDNETLKVMLLQTGVKTEKQMKRSDIIAMLKKKANEVEIVED